MRESIVALLSDERTVSQILCAAERLAGFTGKSTINALVIRLDAHRTALITNVDPAQLCDERLREDEEKIRAQEDERSSALRFQFDGWVRSSRAVRVNWIDREGQSEVVFDTLRDQPDYLVVARPDCSSSLAEHEALLAAVFASGRPTLVMPPHAVIDFGKCIAIAWNGDQDTLQLATDSLRLFPNAEEVHFLIGRTPGTPEPSNLQTPVHQSTSISYHILNVDHEQSLGEALLTAASLLNVDLLVSGATSHSTWHVLLFGNVTKVLLHKADIPLLLYYNNATNV